MRCTRLPLTVLALFLCVVAPARAQKAQPFVDLGKDGHLVYESDAQGNRVPDFSFAGYAGGGVPIPNVSTRVTVSPVPGDNGARIQAAIDYVGRLPLGADGIRGAVLLQKGRFPIADHLTLHTNGVVLRGMGSGPDGTVLIATGNSRRTLIELKGISDRKTVGPVRQVTDLYVPVNARSLTLDSTDGLKIGDPLQIERPSPASWLKQVGMAPVPGRPAPGWAADKMNIVWERRVRTIEGTRVTVDAPLTCALEKEFGGGRVTVYEWPHRLRQVGIENLRCESEWDHANQSDEEHAWMAIMLSQTEDDWVRGVTAANFVSSAISIDETCGRVTVEDCASLAPVSELVGYRRHSFYTDGQQTLFLRCRAESGRHDFGVGWMAAGPNAFVECTAHDAHEFSGPLESWATGVLYDNITMDGGGLHLDNRELWDNGVGWAAANCVLWQCSVPVIVARTPPGAHNWVMGCWGQFSGDASWRTPNEFVHPDSLYAAQLADRVGAEAATQTLAASKGEAGSGVGALSLADALRQSPPPPTRPPASPTKTLQKKDGWLLVGGLPLRGDQVDISWWRGQAQPGRAETFGPSITRFVPGRVGPGLTDDLDALTDDMLSQNKATLRHHWGLWYDRRREDHEMIRRIDSDVWPPFYEQPWARSGIGRIWNGLSKYDLTKFNPWYFGRLRAFADQCAQKGLLLVDGMYFQHNILEAGAHWVDFPWRPANCLQPTGFPEPPPFVGKKRIFMADAFYDVSNPVRRDLHQRFIRHCLDNLSDNPNVVHVLGEEYSGPLSFMQFWLDTVAGWRADHPGKKVLIGLSAPRDVQDTILADPKRSAQIDVIDFKYWWQSGNQVYAPKGGQNLAPRQSEREWKGGRPDDADLARMAAEYRRRFPDKAILSDFASARWAYLCAGGSQANLPRTTDARLLQAAARMQPWASATTKTQWAIREPGRGLLLYSAASEPSVTLDLSGETGRYMVFAVNAATGAVTPQGEPVTAGATVTVPKPAGGKVMLWLTKE